MIASGAGFQIYGVLIHGVGLHTHPVPAFPKSPLIAYDTTIETLEASGKLGYVWNWTVKYET